MRTDSPSGATFCVSCNQELLGKYCSNCGEKKIDLQKDFKVSKFLAQALDGFTHLDSKIFNSFISLIFRPGVLTKAYVEGRRVAYMKPLQLFLVASLIFYFVLPHSSAYFSLSFQLDHGLKTGNHVENLFSYDAMSRLWQKSEAKQIAIADLIEKFQLTASDRSKGFLFIIVPFIALLLWAFFANTYRYYVIHLVFALHSFSFFLLWDLIYLNILKFLKFPGMDNKLLVPLIVGYTIHLLLSIRKFYGQGVILSFIKTIFVALFFFAAIAVYRQAISIWTIESL